MFIGSEKKMKKLLAIGEALVDIFNEEIKVGGAPLNVCGAYSKLGGKAYFIGKLSNDEYGVLIKNKMQKLLRYPWPNKFLHFLFYKLFSSIK